MTANTETAPKSVLDAIKMGLWDFEPAEVASTQFAATDAMPGTRAKLDVLAQRVKSGLPLWHPADRDEVPEERGEFAEPARGAKPR